jgi:hypothetical protein
VSGSTINGIVYLKVRLVDKLRSQRNQTIQRTQVLLESSQMDLIPTKSIERVEIDAHLRENLKKLQKGHPDSQVIRYPSLKTPSER